MPIINHQYCDIAISQAVQITDSITSEKIYIYSQLGSKAEYIVKEVRNIFYKGSTSGLLKYASKFIHHGKRKKVINRRFILVLCPRCQAQEDWMYVILCNTLQSERREFIIQLYNKLIKANTNDNNKQSIITMLSNIVSYFNKENKKNDTKSSWHRINFQRDDCTRLVWEYQY